MDVNKYKLVKYKGNKNFICALYNRDSKYFCLYGRTTTPKINETMNTMDTYMSIYEPFVTNYSATFSTNFVCNQNNHLFTIITLNKEEDFDLVYTILESVYGND